eukprot:3778473-Pyramimonas_sp.AAC.1
MTQFLPSIIALDAGACKASVAPDAEEDLPISAAYDVEAAFPSLGHQWLFEIMSVIGPPPCFLNFTHA